MASMQRGGKPPQGTANASGDGSIMRESNVLLGSRTYPFWICRFFGGITADNLGDGKRVAITTLGDTPVLLLTDDFLFELEFERHGSPPQPKVR